MSSACAPLASSWVTADFPPDHCHYWAAGNVSKDLALSFSFIIFIKLPYCLHVYLQCFNWSSISREESNPNAHHWNLIRDITLDRQSSSLFSCIICVKLLYRLRAHVHCYNESSSYHEQLPSPEHALAHTSIILLDCYHQLLSALLEMIKCIVFTLYFKIH